jgi:hypothetical protein
VKHKTFFTTFTDGGDPHLAFPTEEFFMIQKSERFTDFDLDSDVTISVQLQSSELTECSWQLHQFFAGESPPEEISLAEISNGEFSGFVKVSFEVDNSTKIVDFFSNTNA